jgi:hypothetical protein
MNFNLVQNIQGENLINKLAANELKNLLPQLEKYVGTKILTQSGKSAKFKYEHTKENNFRCYLDISTYSIWLCCDVSTQDEADKNGVSSCTYFKKNIHLGTMDENGILKSLETFEKILNDYTLTDIIELNNVQYQINKYKELAQQLELIERNFKLDKKLLK